MLHSRVVSAKPALSDEIKARIVALIREGTFESNRLPAEAKLARHFGVSINVVREALLLLREDGIVTKKHGSGNYFHVSALNVKNRLDRNPDFLELLSASGYRVFQAPLAFESVLPPEPVREVLRLGPKDTALYNTSVIYADGNPAILCASWFPEALYKGSLAGKSIQTTFFRLLTTYCRHELAYGQMEFVAACAGELERDQLGLPMGTPHIHIEESFYSLEDIPLVFSRNKLNRKYVQANTFLS